MIDRHTYRMAMALLKKDRLARELADAQTALVEAMDAWRVTRSDYVHGGLVTEATARNILRSVGALTDANQKVKSTTPANQKGSDRGKK